MPKIEVIRKGVTAAVRPVPTDTTLAVLPVTLDRLDREVESEDEEAVRIDSVEDAFNQFKPAIHFETHAGPMETRFVADLEFRSLRDFSPESIQKRVPGQRNDIAELKSAIDLLYRMKDRWSLPSVRRAWSNENDRRQILAALAMLRIELKRIAQEGKETNDD
jgi:type VI secretion system protein ImpB